MLTWTEKQTKAVRLSRDTTPATRIQLKQDMTTGYAMFNAKLARYYSRKQQFTSIAAGQSIYQTPIDCIKVTGMTLSVGSSDTYKVPIKEIKSEYEWRQIISYPYDSNWPAFFFNLGNDAFQVWPEPSQTVLNGIRYYYQPQGIACTVEDIVSSALSPAETVTMTNGQTLVTSTGASFTSQLIGLQFQLTGVTDTTFYDIVAVPTASTLTLKSAFTGNSASSLNYRIGQCGILPNQYQDADIHYALGYFFMSKGNNTRAQYHLGSDEDGKRGIYWSMVQAAIQDYSSSSTGSVLTDDDYYYNPWMLNPLPGV